MAIVSIRSIDAVTTKALLACGVDQNSIEAILPTIHYANCRGVPTHGVGRLPLYVKKIQAGNLNPKDEIETVVDSDAVAVLDAHDGFGQVAASHAMQIGMDKAKRYGIAVVGVRNSNNFGTAGYFGDMAARNGLAAIIFANAAPAIAPTGGNKTIFGTNPLCYAFPGNARRNPIVLDMATTVAARGKIRLAAKNGEKIPRDWAVGADGKPTDDPNEALLGSLLPIGGYKGYGLSLFVDLFAGLLTGSACAGEVRPLSKMDSASRNGHLFILIDVSRFLSDDELDERMDAFYQAVKSCGAEGNVLLPGERGYRRMAEQKTTVEISQKQLHEINETAERVGIQERLEEV